MTISKIDSDDDARTLSRLAIEIFGFGSEVIVPKRPKWAYVARNDDGEIVGGVILKQLGAGVGIVDFIFVASKGRGQGLGPKLLDIGVKALDDAGCTKQLALIRDDNTPSWNMFAKRGYVVPSIFKVLFGGSFRSFLYSLLMVFALTGYSLWMRDPGASQSTVDPDARLRLKGGLFIAVPFAVFVGAALGRFGAFGPEWLLSAIGMVAGVSVVRILLTYPFARAFGPVEYRLSHGGGILTIVNAFIGSWWPHLGFWAPRDQFWHVSQFKRHEGMAALVGWIVTLLIYPLSFLIPIEGIAEGVRGLSIPVLIYQAVPVFPFEGMDGFRVRQWSPPLYFVGLAATLACFVHLFAF